MNRWLILVLGVGFLVGGACAFPEESWFTITKITLPGEDQPVGTIDVLLTDNQGVEVVEVDVYLENSGLSPDLNRGTGIRLESVQVIYTQNGGQPPPSLIIPVTGYLPAPEEGSESRTTSLRVQIFPLSHILFLQEPSHQPSGSVPFPVVAHIVVEGETDYGRDLDAEGEVTLLVDPLSRPTPIPTP